MNRIVSLLFFLAVIAARATSLSELEEGFQLALSQIAERRAEAIDKLNARYKQALKKEQEVFQNAADLERALLVKAEIEALEKNSWPLPILDEKIQKKISSLRKTYETQRFSIEKVWAQSLVRDSNKMESALSALVAKLTKGGNLASAKAAQTRLEELKADPELRRAKEFSARVDRFGRSKSAMIVRRSGDDLEVLVRFDSAGKVSMESPIENVVERTSGRKELGDTSAKTLGEFVGDSKKNKDSKHPFVSAMMTAKDKNLNLLPDSFGVTQKLVKLKDVPCLEIQIHPKAKGPYFYLEGNLRTGSGGGTFEIAADYMIPSTNKEVKGFVMRHGSSKGERLGSPFEGASSWVAKTQRCSGKSELGKIRCDFSGVKKLDRARGDRVLVRGFAAKHIRFSAYIVESYTKFGGEEIKQSDSKSQKLVVDNGTLQQAIMGLPVKEKK